MNITSLVNWNNPPQPLWLVTHDNGDAAYLIPAGTDSKAVEYVADSIDCQDYELTATPINDTSAHVDIAGEYGTVDGSIHIHKAGREVVMWDSLEWVEDPSLVYVIANAIRKAYEGVARAGVTR